MKTKTKPNFFMDFYRDNFEFDYHRKPDSDLELNEYIDSFASEYLGDEETCDVQ